MSTYPENTPDTPLAQEEHLVTTDELLRVHPHSSPIPVIPQLSMALGLLLLVFGGTYIGASQVVPKTEAPDVLVTASLPALSTDTHAQKEDIYADTKLEARSAIVWDVKAQKVLFNKNADDSRPLASITKLMTALVASEILDDTAFVPIYENSLRTEGDSGFVDGETFKAQDLVDLTLIESSNDGASALSAEVGSIISDTKNGEPVFVRAMNIKAEELGLEQTYFKNSTGLDISETEAGAYGSARDVAHLMEYIIRNYANAVALTTADVATIKNADGKYHVAENTNEVVNDIDGLVASKTGYTKLSGGNLVVAVNVGLNRPVIIVVLGSSHAGRFSDTLTLLEKTRTYIGGETS